MPNPSEPSLKIVASLARSYIVGLVKASYILREP